MIAELILFGVVALVIIIDFIYKKGLKKIRLQMMTFPN